MPLYDFECPACGDRQEHFSSIADRDRSVVSCEPCSTKDVLQLMKRLPGGHGMLYFEEGRPRTHYALSDKPITSHAQQKRLMREHGLAEAGNELPPRMKAKGIKPKKEQLAEITSANKGRWF